MLSNARLISAGMGRAVLRRRRRRRLGLGQVQDLLLSITAQKLRQPRRFCTMLIVRLRNACPEQSRREFRATTPLQKRLDTFYPNTLLKKAKLYCSQPILKKLPCSRKTAATCKYRSPVMWTNCPKNCASVWRIPGRVHSIGSSSAAWMKSHSKFCTLIFRRAQRGNRQRGFQPRIRSDGTRRCLSLQP